MAKTSFVDHKARTGIPGVKGLGSVTNSEEWGARKAVEWTGQGVRTFPPPADRSAPEDKNSRCSDASYNDVRANSWLRGGGKGGEDKPFFDHGKKGK